MFKLIFLVAALVAVSSGDTIRTTVETEQWVKDIHCCNGDTVDRTELDKITEHRRECTNKILGVDGLSLDIFNCEKLRDVREETICLVECTGRKLGVTDDKGIVKRDALILHLKNMYKNTEWKVRTTETIVDKCMSLLRTDLVVEEGKCNPTTMNMIHCIWKEFIRTCPKELRNDRLGCTKLRQRMERGDENHLRSVHFLELIRLLEIEHGTVTTNVV